MRPHINRRDFLKVAALAPLMASNYPGLLETSSPLSYNLVPPNILIIILDAFSAKNVSLFGYPRNTTPNFERLAERAVVYHKHYSTAGFTTPGTASLLTGTYPWTHRAIHLRGTVENSLVNNNIFRLIAEKGYNRIAFTQNLLSFYLLYQFSKDIDQLRKMRDNALKDFTIADRIFYNDFIVAKTSEVAMLPVETAASGSLFLSLIYRWIISAQTKHLTKELEPIYPDGLPEQNGRLYTLEPAIDWLINMIPSIPQPYLGFFHLLPPHEPYLPRREFVGRFIDSWKPISKPRAHFSLGYRQKDLNQYRRSYDEYILNCDAELGRMIDEWDKNGTLDNTYVIITSDHGEMFERGIKAHTTESLYDPVVTIPLMILEPGRSERHDIYVNTSSIDLLPTILHFAGLSTPDWAEGEILPPFANANDNNQRPIFLLDAKSNPKLAPLEKASFGILKGHHKLLHYRGYDESKTPPDYEMFNLAEDPEELTDIYKSEKAIASELKDILLARLEEANKLY